MADPIVSRKDLGDQVGEDLSASDAALAAVDAASEVCRTFAEQTFNLIEDDEIALDGSGTDALLLPQLPVTEVSEVVVGDGDPLVADDDYKLNGNGVLLRPRGTWRKGRQNISVTYSHGYADEDLPRDVRMVALMLATRIYNQGPATFASMGSYSVRYSEGGVDLTAGEKNILRKYRQAN